MLLVTNNVTLTTKQDTKYEDEGIDEEMENALASMDYSFD